MGITVSASQEVSEAFITMTMKMVNLYVVLTVDQACYKHLVHINSFNPQLCEVVTVFIPHYKNKGPETLRG